MCISRRAVVLAALPLLLIGCHSGPSFVPVQGIVTRGGKPVPHVLVTFNAVDGSSSSWGFTDAQGHFELSFNKDTKGTVLGKHKVTVKFVPRTPQEEFDLAAGKIQLHPDQDAINEKYGDLATTPLVVEVTRSDQLIELKID